MAVPQREIAINLGPAYINLDPMSYVPKAQTDSISAAWKKYEAKEDIRGLDLTPIEEVILNMLGNETSINLEGRIPIVKVAGGADTLREVINITTPKIGKKAYAVPLPSWHFWEMGNFTNDTNFAFFEATNPQRLVEGFEKTCEIGQKNGIPIGALIVSNPANPPIYRIDESTGKALHEISKKYDVKIILDEVTRGSLPKGDRDSAGRYMPEALIVEGMRKRLGDSPSGLSLVSYILLPSTTDKLQIKVPQDSLILGEALKLMLEYAEPQVNATLTRRNKILDEVLTQTSDGLVRVSRPADSYLLSNIHLPSIIDPRLFSAMLQNIGIQVFPFNQFYEREFPVVDPVSLTSLRVSVGLENEDRIAFAANIMGKTVKNLVSKIK